MKTEKNFKKYLIGVSRFLCQKEIPHVIDYCEDGFAVIVYEESNPYINGKRRPLWDVRINSRSMGNEQGLLEAHGEIVDGDVVGFLTTDDVIEKINRWLSPPEEKVCVLSLLSEAATEEDFVLEGKNGNLVKENGAWFWQPTNTFAFVNCHEKYLQPIAQKKAVDYILDYANFKFFFGSRVVKFKF